LENDNDYVSMYVQGTLKPTAPWDSMGIFLSKLGGDPLDPASNFPLYTVVYDAAHPTFSIEIVFKRLKEKPDPTIPSDKTYRLSGSIEYYDSGTTGVEKTRINQDGVWDFTQEADIYPLGSDFQAFYPDEGFDWAATYTYA